MRFRFGVIAGLAVLYFVAAKLGLLLAALSPSATPVWPPTGIAFAACLMLGYRVWPAIFVGAFLANVTNAGSVGTSLAIAAGNTLEALVGAYLVNRLANGPGVFDRARDIFAFVGLAALASTTVSATLGLASLTLGGYAQWAGFGPVCPASSSSSAFFGAFMYSSPVFRPTVAPMIQSTIAAMIQPSQIA